MNLEGIKTKLKKVPPVVWLLGGGLVLLFLLTRGRSSSSASTVSSGGATGSGVSGGGGGGGGDYGTGGSTSEPTDSSQQLADLAQLLAENNTSENAFRESLVTLLSERATPATSAFEGQAMPTINITNILPSDAAGGASAIPTPGSPVRVPIIKKPSVPKPPSLIKPPVKPPIKAAPIKPPIVKVPPFRTPMRKPSGSSVVSFGRGRGTRLRTPL